MNAPPGPRGAEVLEFFGRGSFARTLQFLEGTARRYGPISSFRIGPRRLYLIDDPELIRDVLVTQQHRFARSAGIALMRDLLGDGLLTSEEPLHRRRRRILQPAFHRRQIASYADAMIAEARRLAAEWREASTVDVGSAMMRLALAVTAKSLFGADVRDEEADAISARFRDAMEAIGTLVPVIEILPPRVGSLYRRLPLPANSRIARARREVGAAIHPLIEARRRGAAAGQDRDLLSLLVNARDEDGRALDDEALAAELATLLIAGHETTALALTWAWYALAEHPAVEARLHAELDAVLGGGRDPGAQDLPRLPYTAAVLMETLRLYPPAPAIGRRVCEPVRLADYDLPREASVVLSPYVTQRNPRLFERPLVFRPERWEIPSWPPFAFFPFGGGARICIGEHFALMEGTLVLATLAHRFRLRRIDAGPVGFASQVTLRPDRPIRMEALARADHP